MFILSTISNGSRTCGGQRNGLHRTRQVSLLLGAAVLYLSLLAVAPIPNCHSAPARLSDGWSVPQSGWLYVLDPEVGADQSMVWLVDPEEGVKGGLKTGYAPFFALSPDGARLYVSSRPPAPTGAGASSYELWAIDTASGVLLQQAELPNRLNYTLPGPGGLAVSPDGRYVHVANSRTIRPGVHQQTIQTFDTVRKRFLPEEAGLPGCGYPIIVPVAGAWQLVVCCGSRGTRLINPAADGSVKESRTVEVPIVLSAVTRGGRVVQRPVAQISPSADARKLGLIMNNGEVFEAEIGDSPFRIHPTLAPPLRLSHRVLHTRVASRSPDGSQAFVGCAPRDLIATSLTADEIHVFNTTSSWTREAIIRTPVPFSDLVLSADGRDLFAISPETRTLLTIDPATGQVENSVGGIGVKPRFLAIAP